jgi:multiple sugar transport system ATP-binding protein
VKLTEEEKEALLPYAGKEIELGVRPEDVIGGGEVAMNVFSNENLGMNTLVHGHIGENNRISAKLRGWYDYKDGDSVNIAFGRKHFFDKETGAAIERRKQA